MWRIESAHIVGTLARYTGDFALAEDVAQEALAAALVTWPRDGVPANPAGWLLTTARRRAIDAFRRRSALDERYAALAHQADEAEEPDWDPDRIEDDVLALMFISCHPALSREAQVALTLRVVGGLTSDEIARGFLVPTATVQARITRAKKTLAAARVPFEVPPPEERRERLGSVLSVVYLIFTEGSSATAGSALIRTDLAREAIRQARMLAQLMPEPETYGLLALLELTAARFPARLDADGEPVLLEDQDRRRWDRSAIRRGRAALAAAGSGRPRPRVVRRAGGDRRVPRGRALGRGDRLEPDRRPLRGARPARAVAGRRPQPRGRGRRWPTARRRPCRSSTSSSPPARSPARTCCPPSAVSCSPGSGAPTRRGTSSRPPYACVRTSPSVGCSERKIAALAHAAWVASSSWTATPSTTASRCPPSGSASSRRRPTRPGTPYARPSTRATGTSTPPRRTATSARSARRSPPPASTGPRSSSRPRSGSTTTGTTRRCTGSTRAPASSASTRSTC